VVSDAIPSGHAYSTNAKEEEVRQGTSLTLHKSHQQPHQGQISMELQCAECHEDVSCELCSDRNKYFEGSKAKCAHCPSFSMLGTLADIFTGIAMLILVIIHGAHRLPDFEHFLYKLLTLLTSINIQAKLKIIVSFYQVAITLKPVYGVQIHSTFTS